MTYRELYLNQTELKDNSNPKFESFFLCPCCYFPTLTERSGYEICPICRWEDDGQDESTAEEVWGGPNSNYSLSEARINFQNGHSKFRENDKLKIREDRKINKKLKLIELYEKLLETPSENLLKEILKSIKQLC